MIMVLSIDRSEHGTSFELQAEKKAAYIYVSSHYVQVICKNASHSVWRGAGKVFHGDNAWDQAKEAYKSSEMKAMIDFARGEMESIVA